MDFFEIIRLFLLSTFQCEVRPETYGLRCAEFFRSGKLLKTLLLLLEILGDLRLAVFL